LAFAFCGCAQPTGSTDESSVERNGTEPGVDASTDATAAPNPNAPAEPSGEAPRVDGGARRTDGATPSNEPKAPDAGRTSIPVFAPDTGAAQPIDATTERIACESLAPLVPGQNYGPFSLVALRVDPELDSGTYVIASPPGTTGVAEVYANDQLLGEFSYDAYASLRDGMNQTVVFAGLFELDLRSQTEPDLHTLGDHPFDGCHTVVVEPPATVHAGGEFGSFLVSELLIDPQALAGEYTFYTPSGNLGSVDLLRDGVTVYTLEYQWQTTVGAGESFSFIFPSVLTMTVTRVAGTSNLFGLATELFDGRHVLLVPET